MEDGCDFTLIVWVLELCACVYVCVHMGWEVLVEFLRAMLILQAQQALCACLCVYMEVNTDAYVSAWPTCIFGGIYCGGGGGEGCPHLVGGNEWNLLRVMLNSQSAQAETETGCVMMFLLLQTKTSHPGR